MKKLFKIVLYTIGILTVFLFFIYKYFEFAFDKNLKSEELNSYILEIKNSKELPEKFYKIYEEVNPDGIKNGTIKASIENTESQSRNVARRIFFQVKKAHESRIRNLTFEYFLTEEIENHVTQKQCLNWIGKNSNFLYKQKGLEDASLFYFEKNLAGINDDEMKILVKMIDNPVKNNPKIK